MSILLAMPYKFIFILLMKLLDYGFWKTRKELSNHFQVRQSTHNLIVKTEPYMQSCIHTLMKRPYYVLSKSIQVQMISIKS